MVHTSDRFPHTPHTRTRGATPSALLTAARQWLARGWAGSGVGEPVVLAPWTRHHAFTGFPDVPGPIRPGWVQLPGARVFAIGFFLSSRRFMQIALADDRGRVYATDEPNSDLHGREPEFFLFKEGEWTIPDGPRVGHTAATGGRTIRVAHGGVVCAEANGVNRWLASWIEAGRRYTLEQLRVTLPDELRVGLEYRDAVTVAFFAAYLLPKMRGLLLGFGSGNIFRRLEQQAPLSAIRDSARDAAEARAHGLRTSGLEDHAVMLMREIGALGDLPALQPDHGAEPMHLITSELSGNYFLTWDTSLPFDAALTSMRIEGNLNRFAQVSSWLETNASHGIEPTEDTVSQAQAALIDQALLTNPALSAFPRTEPIDVLHGPAFGEVNRLISIAADTAQRIARANPAPQADQPHGEWVLRQTLASLLRRLRLPYRFDTDFRDDLEAGRLAIAFTAAGPALMPASEYIAATHDWIDLDDAARAQLSARYNLRVGLMMAALAFGASPRIHEVSVIIDSIGLEEAIKEQDSAIKAMMSDALSTFEQWHDRPLDFASGKASPKDGDQHGNPMAIGTANGPEPQGAPADDEFEQLMRGGGIDEVTFAFDERDGQNGGQGGHAAGTAIDEQLERLRTGPTLTTLATVTFTREAFLRRLRDDGLEHPDETFAMFHAAMTIDAEHGLAPTPTDLTIHDARFEPRNAQMAPESQERALTPAEARAMGATDTFGLAIQRDDLLAYAVARFHELAADDAMPSVDKAQQAMRLIDRIGDPELTDAAPEITAALIDGRDTPDPVFEAGARLDDARVKARDLLFSGQVDQAVEHIESVVAALDEQFAAGDGVPRYFNSYADRVIYNHLFAIRDERTVLIPDNLFYAHMELADALAQIKGAKEALPHLNRLVAYAPSYALSHLKLAVQLAREEDWDSVRAACLNALRVSIDRADAGYAYYRLAQAAWMRDEFAVAVAAYMMSDAVAPNQVPSLGEELSEVRGRATSQNIPIPTAMAQAQRTLAEHDIPVWPGTEVAPIMLRAARVGVDQGMFVPARTLAVAAARMGEQGIDAVQLQFLRSLNA